MGQSAPSIPVFTVSAELVSGLMECAAQCGVRREQLAVIVDQSKENATGAPPARYAAEVVLKLWDRVLRLTEDPAIGFQMALKAGPKTFGVLGQILPRCTTMLDAFRQVERYSGIASQGARVSVAADRKTITVSVLSSQLPPGDIKRTVMLWGLTNLCLLPERLTGVVSQPKSVSCAHPEPSLAATRAIRERFPISFGADANELVFDRSVGDLAIPTADADLRLLLAEVMDRHLAALGPAGSFEQGILTVLRSMMDGNIPTLASLSARSGMSQRTLQRRLAESNTSFQQLLRQVLREMSNELLSRENLSHGEIAFLLGYSEESAFSRAYKSWTGHPPGQLSGHRAAAR